MQDPEPILRQIQVISRSYDAPALIHVLPIQRGVRILAPCPWLCVCTVCSLHHAGLATARRSSSEVQSQTLIECHLDVS